MQNFNQQFKTIISLLKLSLFKGCQMIAIFSLHSFSSVVLLLVNHSLSVVNNPLVKSKSILC